MRDPRHPMGHVPREFIDAYSNLRLALTAAENLCLCRLEERGDEGGEADYFALATSHPQYVAEFPQIAGLGIVPLAIIIPPQAFERLCHPPTSRYHWTRDETQL